MLRVLLLADTHLGIDTPRRPRVERRRRGLDFERCYLLALEPAFRGQIDLVVHGGDVFHRSSAALEVVERAFAPLKRLADEGVPVVVVPGNHERGVMPHPLLSVHPGIHVLRQPRTVELTVAGITVAVGGWPYRSRVRSRFARLLAETQLCASVASVRLLCLHHAVEGARVGPAEHVFRDAPDVVRGRDLPNGIAAVLSGHIHRHQLLSHDLGGRPLPAPVLYPGSVERTAFAEAGEAKGYLTMTLEPDQQGGRLSNWELHQLPARPMFVRQLPADASETGLRALFGALPSNAVVQLRSDGDLDECLAAVVSAASLRCIAPATMNVALARARARS